METEEVKKDRGKKTEVAERMTQDTQREHMCRLVDEEDWSGKRVRSRIRVTYYHMWQILNRNST